MSLRLSMHSWCLRPILHVDVSTSLAPLIARLSASLPQPIMISHPPKSPHTFSAAQVIAANDDLLAEILSRLPVRPLLRFKCVSKLWRSLISSTQFSHLHTRRYRTYVSGIFVHTSPGLVDPHYQFVPTLYDDIPFGSPFDSLNFVQDPAGIKILQSCNGLLLCCSLRKNYSSRKFYVYNPSTNQFSTLTPPVTCAADKSTPILGLTLAFDPSKSPYYKVVCVRSSAVSVYHDQIEIYSSETCTWRSSGSAFLAPFDMVFDDGVFWNGAIHWISPTGFNALYFNVERERFGEMPRLPADESWGSRKFRYLGESGDHLHLIEIRGPCTTQFKVLELKKDYSKWFVKYNVDLQALVDQFPEATLNYFDHFNSLSCALVVLFLAREDHRKDKDASLLLHIAGKVISYNLKDKTFRKLCDLAPHGTQTRTCPQFGLLDACQYIETLASV